MSNLSDLCVVIPDYKSSFLEKTIESALAINPKEIVISNFKTKHTSFLEEKYKNLKNIKFYLLTVI